MGREARKREQRILEAGHRGVTENVTEMLYFWVALLKLSRGDVEPGYRNAEQDRKELQPKNHKKSDLSCLVGLVFFFFELICFPPQGTRRG